MKHPTYIPFSPQQIKEINMTNPYIQPNQKMSLGKKVGIGVAIFFGVALLANACDSTTEPKSNLDIMTEDITTSTLAPTTTTVAGPKTSFAGGIYLVGTQIEAGTYQAPGGSNCYYERRSDTSSDLGGIIVNEWSTDTSQQIVTIDATDVAFKSQGCGLWTKI